MDFLKGVSQSMRAAAQRNTFDEFSRLETELVKTKNEVKERIQSLTAERVKAIIQKLEKNQPVSDEEKDFVRLWVVGDAQGLTRMKDVLQDALSEFQKLSDLIQDFENKKESVTELVNLHGVLEDSLRVVAEVTHFLEDQERIERFEKAIKDLDREESKFIAKILHEELIAPDM